MNKKYLVVILAVLLVLSLSACGNTAEADTPPPTGETAMEAPPDGPPEGQPPAPAGQSAAAYEPVELALSSPVIEGILDAYSTKSFAAGEVSEEAIEAILYSGAKAPSATNAQPWHFTVVRESATAESLASRNYCEGAVVIVVSGVNDAGVGVPVAFDCALATQNMYLAAQSLGYGAHLYYGGVDEINRSRKEELGIPEEYEAQIILLVGQIDAEVDAVSAASARKDLGDLVNYID